MNIDDVITRLDVIIEEAKLERSPSGYFPALYRMVTVAVKQGIENGDFDDGPRMERLDVVFASRYLDAYDAWRAGQATTESWALAFEATEAWWPIVLQHLLLGMNAHINLDLGVAAARVAPGDQLPSLNDDFNRINEILARLVDKVQTELADIWPPLKILDYTAAKTDEAIVNFAMGRARDHAWGVAERLAPLTLEDQAPVIAEVDANALLVGRAVRRPGLLIGAVLTLVRLGELGTVPRKIEALEGIG